MEAIKNYTKVGAGFGMIMAVLGILPGFYFGSYGALMILHSLFGSVEPNTVTRIAVVVGTLLGITCTAFASIVIGSVFGTAIGFMATSTAKLFAVQKTEAKEYLS